MPGGFRTGEQKMAFLRGAIDAVAGFPADVLKVMRGEPAEHAGPPLTVITAIQASARFSTDRGRRELPAWKVQARDVPEPIWVIDPAIIRHTWWPPDGQVREWTGTTAVLDPDGRTITMTFPGGPANRTQYPTTEVLESGGALALIPVKVDTGPAGFRTTVGYSREVTVTLARPLGNRVVLDQVGAPVMVNSAIRLEGSPTPLDIPAPRGAHSTGVQQRCRPRTALTSWPRPVTCLNGPVRQPR